MKTPEERWSMVEDLVYSWYSLTKSLPDDSSGLVISLERTIARFFQKEKNLTSAAAMILSKEIVYGWQEELMSEPMGDLSALDLLISSILKQI